MVHDMVKSEFKEMFKIITMPFIVITAPVALLCGYLIMYQFQGTANSTQKLATEINQLSISVARLEEKISK